MSDQDIPIVIYPDNKDSQFFFFLTGGISTIHIFIEIHFLCNDKNLIKLILQLFLIKNLKIAILFLIIF